MPFELLLAAPFGGRAGPEGVGDIEAILRLESLSIAGDIDLPTRSELYDPENFDLWPPTIRPAEENLREYGERVIALVVSIFAADIARLQAEAGARWAAAREEYERHQAWLAAQWARR